MKYPGLTPSNVNRDAKYSVVSSRNGGPMEVRLLYVVSQRELALLTTDDHEDLVEMVNREKIHATGQPGGAFYINEYLHVLVPTAEGCVFAGHYEKLLEFDFDGGVIGPRAPEGLEPGDDWPGPHVGIRYTLTATGDDIRYSREIAPRRIQQVLLSDEQGTEAAAQLARRLAKTKGPGGGRIYINEAGEFFAPVDGGYQYLGPLDEDVWFSLPDVPGP